MTRPITAGIDGSDESLAALAWAGREAVRRRLPLRVLHAWQYAPHETLGADGRDIQAGWVRQGVEDAVRAVADRHPGLEVSTEVLEGAPAETLLGAGEYRKLLESE